MTGTTQHNARPAALAVLGTHRLSSGPDLANRSKSPVVDRERGCSDGFHQAELILENRAGQAAQREAADELLCGEVLYSLREVTELIGARPSHRNARGCIHCLANHTAMGAMRSSNAKLLVAPVEAIRPRSRRLLTPRGGFDAS